MRRLLLLAALSAAACAKTAPPEAAADGMRAMPGPLEAKPFVMPDVEEATLANGIPVRVVTNREVPLWDLRLVIRLGNDPDPQGQEGLASVTFDMLNEGAAGMDAAALATQLKQLGGSVGAGASDTTATISASGPTKNLADLVALWGQVLLQPDFPAEDWALMQDRRLAGLKNKAEDPVAIARDVASVVTWGDATFGRLPTEASYSAITPDDMRAFHGRALDPSRAIVFAGGDIDAATLVPLLDAALAAWTAPADPLPEVDPTPAPFEGEVIYLVDKPGAAQSVLRAALPVADRSSSTWRPADLAVTAMGGQFTARVNMNLREDKGWTYGARCGMTDTAGPSALFYCSTSVQADATGPALAELRKEVVESVTSRPLTDDEIDYFRDNQINSFYGGYELPASLLGSLQDIWFHGLPADWLETFVPDIQGITTEAANEAMQDALDTGRIAWIVVGDVATQGEAVEALGLPVVRLDDTGKPLQATP